MATTVTAQTLNDGARNLVVKLQLAGDGNDGTATAVDLSAHAGTADTVRVDRITWSLEGFPATLAWDASTDVDFFTCTSGEGHQCFRSIGGLPNTKASGYTGDITVTTTGAAAGEKGTITLHMVKK